MKHDPLWTVAEMARAMKAERRGDLPEKVSGISIDSRTLAHHEAYFAIKGDVHDGHAFVDAALANGAALAVVAGDKLDGLPAGAPLLRRWSRARPARATSRMVIAIEAGGRDRAAAHVWVRAIV